MHLDIDIIIYGFFNFLLMFVDLKKEDIFVSAIEEFDRSVNDNMF